ncbi:MAG: NADH-quinone oxidoreductase subunit J [Phycisphaerales bacterium]|nr:NADH-quinone oxidoreductase subunit J [Phycisphaerales bacterium]
MDTLINPFLFYGLCVLGAVGVLVALPRQKIAGFAIGVLIGAAALAAFFVVLGRQAVKDGAGLPNFHFYIFSAVALFSALRVITHPRPIYAALWFILTIVSSCGLYLVLQAEFLAFALVIVYGGAILITYMFVIMLASDGPSEDAVEAMTEYDRVSREPVIATFAGFLVLAVLASFMAGGASTLKANPRMAATDDPMAQMAPKVEKTLREAGLLAEGEKLVKRPKIEGGGPEVKQQLALDATLDETGGLQILSADGRTVRTLAEKDWPEALRLSDAQRVGFELIERNPGAIEIAGVILLMAMLGAVVLARKKVELDEQAKLEAMARARAESELGREAEFVQPATGGDN